MPKFFVKSEQINNDEITIINEDVNHIINVFRKKIGDELIVCNQDENKSFITEIIQFDKNKVICKIINKLDENIESNVNITVFQGLPKFDKMELIIQKATEIGVRKIVPVSMKRSIVKFNEKDVHKKIERWRKIAEVAAKQSMRDAILEVDEIKKLKEVYSKIENLDLLLIAYENEKDNTLKTELLNIKKDKTEYNIGILIGPEGGIDQGELEELNKYSNVKIVTLGKRILRTETASLVMVSNILYELEI